MLVNFVSTYLFYHSTHKVHPIRFTSGLFEGEGIILCIYVGGQGVSEVVGYCLERTWISLRGGAAWLKNSLFLGKWTWWQTWTQTQRGQ